MKKFDLNYGYFYKVGSVKPFFRLIITNLMLQTFTNSIQKPKMNKMENSFDLLSVYLSISNIQKQ